MSVVNHARTSAFSPALHSRPTTSLQLRRNHFSVFAASVKRSALKAGASAPMALPVDACLPPCVGGVPWQEAQLQSRPCRLVKKRSPRAAEAGAPACAA